MYPVKVGLHYIEKWKSDLEKQVCNYEAENAPKGQIVFYGPSNFTRWCARHGNTPLREALPGKSGALCCINRGFGSSCAEHHLYYYHRMVKPLEPKVLVYAPGLGNGLVFGYTPEELWFMAQRVMEYAKADFPQLRIYLCGVNLWKTPTETAKKYDAWLQEYAANTPDCTYLDISDYEPLQNKELFLADNVHFNHEGYLLYAEYFKEKLRHELDQF